MKTRIISACIMLPLLIVVYLGGYWLMAAAFIVGIIGLHEFYKGFEAVGTVPCKPLGYAAAVMLYGLNIFVPDNIHRFLSIIRLIYPITIAGQIDFKSRHNILFIITY